MNTYSRNAALRLVIPAITLLAAGCAVGPHKVAQAYYADDPQVWYPRIQALPVEIHGQLPSATHAEIISGVAYGVAGDPAKPFGDSGVSLYATQRVVAYIGGAAVPAKGQYCAMAPVMRTDSTARPGVLMLRTVLCDGPRAVAYVRDPVPAGNLSMAEVAVAIDQAKAELVAALPQPAAPIPMY